MFVLIAATALAARAEAVRAATEPPPTADGPDGMPGALLFSQRCSTCHNIGGGPKVGPDLLGVTSRRMKPWIAKFVRGPGAAIDGGDPIAVELSKKFPGIRMPDQPLTDAELDGVLAYFAACSARGGCQPVPTGPKWGTDGTDDDVTRGRELFLGHRRLQQGGAPCFACHNVRGAAGNEGVMGGGTLGPDLTFAYARLGEKGLTPALAQTATPIMRAVYGEARLEPDEQFALKAYFARLARDGAYPPRERDFFLLGGEGMALVLGLATLRVLRGRKRDGGGS